MSILIFFLLLYFIVLFTYQLIIIYLLLFSKKDIPAEQFLDRPFISILIAARNEESTIQSCLEALSKLNWPVEKMEVLIGNDQSTDNTALVINNFIKERPNFKLYTIAQNLGSAKGKANVLATLAQQAKGEFYYITDADIEVPRNWIQSLLANYNERIGIVSGATKTGGNSLFHYCQKLDWIYAFGMVKVVSDKNIPVSAVGNNMMISKNAYLSTGGYENIPFSITEDLQLFLETLKKGWNYKNLLSPDCIATTKPIESISKLLSQRKRWMHGAMKIPLILLLFLFIQAIFIPIIFYTLYYAPILGICLWFIKITLQQIHLWVAFKKIGDHYTLWKGLFLFEFYAGMLSIIFLFNYFIPTKVEWKGRKY